MSNSTLVCGRSGCGLPVHSVRYSYRHSLGGNTGPIPQHRKHKPVPVRRTDYDKAFDLGTPRHEAMQLLAAFRMLDNQINPRKS